MEKKLYRDELNKKVAGVCAGLAEYLSVDVTIIRVLFLLALIFKGGGGLVYIVLWIALPKKPYNLNNLNVDYTVPPSNDPFNPFKEGTPPFNTGVPPFNPGVPPFAVKPQGKSNAGLIAGIVLVLLGSFFLLNQLDVIPFISFHDVWPVILIIIGVGVIVSGIEKTPKPVEKEKWEGAEAQTEEAAPAANNTSDNTTNEQ
jgi:phage shock protein C